MIKKFFEFIKKIINAKNYEDNNVENKKVLTYHVENISYDDALNLSFGSIIWAKRYKSEEEKDFIEKGHRVGPYIVVGYENGNYLCLPCGSQKFSNSFQYREMELSFYKYTDELTKDCFIHCALFDTLTTCRIFKVLGELNAEDKEKLLKKMRIVQNEGLYVEPELLINYIPLCKKDLFKFDSKCYVVIRETLDNLICIGLKKSNEEKEVFIDGIYYKILLDDIKTFSKNIGIERYSIVEDKAFDMILKKFNKSIKNSQNIETFYRGDLLQDAKGYLYVFGENGNYVMAYRIRTEFIKDAPMFSIMGVNYYSDFKEKVLITKDSRSYIKLGSASEPEMDKIKLAKKDYIKKHPECLKNSNSKIKGNVDSGAIVECILNNRKRYLVIMRNGNQFNNLVVIDENNLYSGNYKLENIHIKEVNYVGTLDPLYFRDLLREIYSSNANASFISKDNMKLLLRKFDY